MSNNLDYLDEQLVEDAKDFLDSSEIELMALALGNNPNKSDNYQLAVSLQLKNAMNNLNYNINRLKKSMDWSSGIMIILTIAILILTAMLVFKGG